MHVPSLGLCKRCARLPEGVPDARLNRASMATLYPMLIEPRSVATIWGGSALADRFGKRPAGGAGNIAESWECFDANTIRNGELAGKTIAQARAELGAGLMGSIDPASAFPILTKLIDARDRLSVQVHPDDAYAMRVEHQPNGKTECWLVLESEPGATIVLGWNRGMSREEYEKRVADGSLGDMLRHVTAEPGDVFYLPAGTVHAIGAGIVLFEVQQTSDLTYRIFDWNRVDASGKPRELHVQKAGDVLNYERATHGQIDVLAYKSDGIMRTALVSGKYIEFERIVVDSGASVPYATEGVPVAVMPLAQPLKISVAGGEGLRVESYQTVLLPAELNGIAFHGLAQTSSVIVAGPPSGKQRERMLLAGVEPGRVNDFLSQF